MPIKSASFRKIQKYHTKLVDAKLIGRAAQRCNMRVVRTDETFIRLRAPINFWSIGEILIVNLGAIEGGMVVDITSTCVLKTQVADWGKNERNVRKLFLSIDELLGANSNHECCLLCKHCDYPLVGIQSSSCPECGCPFSVDEEPAPQEVATLRNAFVLIVVITAIEILVVVSLYLLELVRFIPWIPAGIRGMFYLLFVNAAVIITLFGLHRLVKRAFRVS